VIAATASGVVTALVTAHPSRGLWVALGVAVIVGGALQAAVTYNERETSRRVNASGAGAVAVGGSAQEEIHTRVHGKHPSAAVSDTRDGVTASGPGSVGVGGDTAGPISTEVTKGEGSAADDQA
jgi:hypothetical protein